MIKAETTINLHLFGMPIQLRSKIDKSTVFEAYSDFGNGAFAPDLDKAISVICKQFGVEPFLETEGNIDRVFAQYHLETKRLYLEGIINLQNSKAALIFNFQAPETTEKDTNFAFVLDLNFAFDLADLPIIPINKQDKKLSLTLTFANYDGNFQTILFHGNELKSVVAKNTLERRKITIQSGIQLQPNIQLTKENFSFNYELIEFSPIEKEKKDLRKNITNLSQLPKTKATKWFDVNQSFGGFNLTKIGLQWKNSKATILLNLAYLSNNLEFSIFALKATSSLSLKKIKPRFDIGGIGVYYKNDFIELGGTLLRKDKKNQAYAGKMVLRLAKINIGGIGGFSKTKNGENSFFAFGNTAIPIGGIPAFFITGISIGFGHNSTLKLPAIDEISNFPLLNIIKVGEENPSGNLSILGDFVQEKKDEKWLAAGVNFTSFQLIKGNLILAYEFTKKQVSILGIARLILPTEKVAYLNLEFGLKSIYKIQEGEIQSNTQIQNNSYLIHKDVKLTGSIAIYTWLKGKNEGDFVLTIGGYHPKYKQPKHFPKVPEVGFNWQISETTKMEGKVYFALTNQAIMTGFSFNATYEKGRLKAYFLASANMILQWKPFYYDFQTNIRLSAKYQSRFLKNYKLDIAAKLHLFGPETGGFVNINWSIISFNIKIGNPEKSNFVYILDWNSFRNSFLPINPKDIIKINLNENSFSNKIKINTQSLIPSNILIINDLEVCALSDSFGVRPMNKQQLIATQSLKIINKTTRELIAIKYKLTTKVQNFPAAIWSAKPLNRKALNNEKVNAVSGFENLELIGKPNGKLVAAKAIYLKNESLKKESKFESETREISSLIEEKQVGITELAAEMNTPKTIEKRTSIIKTLNEILAFNNSELLPNDALEETAKKAEEIYQSEPKIGSIRKGKLGLAKAKIKIIRKPKRVEAIAEKKPTLLHFKHSKNRKIEVLKSKSISDLRNRSVQVSPIEEKIHIQLGAVFVFDLNEKKLLNRIQFTSETSIQIIEFDAFNNLIQCHNLSQTKTEFVAAKGTKRLVLKGFIPRIEKYIFWKASDNLPLVNSNALLGDNFYLKMQVPIPEDERFAASVNELERQNFIQTEKGIERGFIDTLVFEDYREIVLVLSQKNSRNSDLELAKKAAKLSIPFVYKKGFNRVLQIEKVELKPRAALIDEAGNIRLKFRLSNHKLMKKTKLDKNWDGFALRLNCDENWKVKALFLFKKRIKKIIWREI